MKDLKSLYCAITSVLLLTMSSSSIAVSLSQVIALDPGFADGDGNGFGFTGSDGGEDLRNTVESAVANTVLDEIEQEEIFTLGTNLIDSNQVQINNLGNRFRAIRAGAQGGLSLSGLSFKLKGQSLPAAQLFSAFGSSYSADFDMANFGDYGWNHHQAITHNKVVVLNNSEDDNSVMRSNPFGKFGVFVTGTIIVGDQDETDQEDGFDFDSTGVTIGVDYRFSNNFVAGVAYGFSDSDSDLDNDAGDVEGDSDYLSLFATYYNANNFYMTATVTTGETDFDTERNAFISDLVGGSSGVDNGDINQQYTAETDADEFSASIGAGFNINRGGLVYGPYAELNYTDIEIDEFTERASNTSGNDPISGGPAAIVPGEFSNLTVLDQDIESLTSTIGAQVSKAISTSAGVFVPQLRVEWVHEFDDDQRDIEAFFPNDTTTDLNGDPAPPIFTVENESPDRNWFNVGAGVSANFANNMTGFIYGETLLGKEDVDQYTVTGGFKVKF